MDSVDAAATLAHILTKYKLDPNTKRMPIEIPNVGRDDLPILFHELGFKVGVEIGVESGLYSIVLAERNPGVKLFCIDSWKHYNGYRDHVSQEKLDGFYLKAKERCAPYDITLIRKFSMDAVKEFADDSLDFVYVDGNHDLPHVIEDSFWWSTKLRRGGIMSGHDFIRRHNITDRVHVVQAIHCFTDVYQIRPWFVLGSQAKDEGLVRDETRSYMWVKP